MKLAPKILVLLISVGIVVRSLLMAWEIFQTREDVLQQNIELHRVLLSSNVESIAAAVYNVEDKRLEVLAGSLFELGEIAQVWIYEEDGTFYRAFERSENGFQDVSKAPEITPFAVFGINSKQPFAPYSASGSRLVSQPLELDASMHRVISTLWVNVNENPVFAGHLVTDFGHTRANHLIWSETRTKILSGLAFICFLIVVIFIFLRRTVISRITYLEHASGRLALRDFSSYHHDIGKDEIASLNRSFFQMAQELKNYSDNLEIIVDERTAELKDSRDRVALILQKIDQGIVTINGRLEIEPEYSAFITRFYQIDDPVGKDVLKTLLPQAVISNDELDQTRQALNSILDTDELCWMANHIKLPNELTIHINGQEHQIMIDWKAIIDEDNITRKVMLTIRDVTESRKLHRKLAEEETRTRIMIDIIKARQKKSHRDLFHTLDLMADKLVPFKAIRTVQADVVRNLLVQMHTVKGETRTIGFRILSQQVHNAESALKEDGLTIARVHELVRDVLNLIELYDQTLEHLFEPAHGEVATTPNILSAMSDGLLDLSRRLMEAGIPLAEVAIQDDIGPALSSKAWEDLKSIFMHGLNNVADHGFIQPYQKTQVLKPARLAIRGFLQNQEVRITVTDNGAGLNLERLREKAEQNQLSFDPDAPENVLFLGGVSTAETVSQTSGRGVGMRAIHDLAQELGGSVTLRQNPSGGSILTLILPVSGEISQRRGRAV